MKAKTLIFIKDYSRRDGRDHFSAEVWPLLFPKHYIYCLWERE
jgi:hypothetical protein